MSTKEKAIRLMDPRLHHPLPILTYMAQAHAPEDMPPQLPPMVGMPGVPPSSASEPAAVSDADLDKHMIAKGLARLPEPHSDTDLELLWRTLATEVRQSSPILRLGNRACNRTNIEHYLIIDPSLFEQSSQYPHRTLLGWQAHFSAHREEIMQILKIIVDNPSASNAHYSFSEEELLVNFYAAGGPSSSSSSPLSWKSFALEVCLSHMSRCPFTGLIATTHAIN